MACSPPQKSQAHCLYRAVWGPWADCKPLDARLWVCSPSYTDCLVFSDIKAPALWDKHLLALDKWDSEGHSIHTCTIGPRTWWGEGVLTGSWKKETRGLSKVLLLWRPVLAPDSLLLCTVSPATCLEYKLFEGWVGVMHLFCILCSPVNRAMHEAHFC